MLFVKLVPVEHSPLFVSPFGQVPDPLYGVNWWTVGNHKQRPKLGLQIPLRIICPMARRIIKDQKGLDWIFLSSKRQFQVFPDLFHEFDEVDLIVSVVNAEDWSFETVPDCTKDRCTMMTVVENNFNWPVTRTPGFLAGKPRVKLWFILVDDRCSLINQTLKKFVVDLPLFVQISARHISSPLHLLGIAIPDLVSYVSVAKSKDWCLHTKLLLDSLTSLFQRQMTPILKQISITNLVLNLRQKSLFTGPPWSFWRHQFYCLFEVPHVLY